VSRLLHPLVAALMLLLFALSAPSLFDQSDFVSVAPQIAGNIAGHLPCAYNLHSAVSSLMANHESNVCHSSHNNI